MEKKGRGAREDEVDSRGRELGGLTDGAEVEECGEEDDAPVAPGDVAAVELYGWPARSGRTTERRSGETHEEPIAHDIEDNRRRGA